ncbi:hypothetical protein Hanom_Chr09g00863321 [Helianthus anomalus]
MEVHNFCGVGASEKSVIQGIVRVACWCIWKARNKAVFSEAVVKVEDIFREVRSLGFLWFKYRSKFSLISWSDWCKFEIIYVYFCFVVLVSGPVLGCSGF